MKYFTTFLLVFNAYTSVVLACKCKAQPELDIRSINDSEFIFTAVLLEYKIGMAVVSLKFKTKRTFKGNIDETITFYIRPKYGHTFFNKNVKFKEQQNWIIFARKKVIGNRNYYRLNDADGTGFCALSRPVEENGKDAYLNFLEENGIQSDGFQKIFNAEKVVIAEGFYNKNTPIKEWKYYRSDGRLLSSGEYQDGKKEGEWRKYTTTSKGETIAIKKKFYHQGELTEIHDLKYSGIITFKKIITDTTEIRNYLFDDGSINSIIHRNKENETMATISYHKNGVKREEKYFEKNRLMYKYQFDESGQKISEWIRED